MRLSDKEVDTLLETLEIMGLLLEVQNDRLANCKCVDPQLEHELYRKYKDLQWQFDSLRIKHEQS